MLTFYNKLEQHQLIYNLVNTQQQHQLVMLILALKLRPILQMLKLISEVPVQDSKLTHLLEKQQLISELQIFYKHQVLLKMLILENIKLLITLLMLIVLLLLLILMKVPKWHKELNSMLIWHKLNKLILI